MGGRLTGLGRFVPGTLRQLDFRRFWIGQTISVFGDQITLLAIPLMAVLLLGAQATEMGTLTAAGLLPHLLFSLPAGVWLDRVRNRRRLMIAADIGRAILIASVPSAYVLGGLTMAQLYVVGFLSGSLAVIFDLSWSTQLVAVTRRDDYVEANALFSGSRSLAYVGGPPIAGLLVQVLSAPLALASDAISFLASAAFLAKIRAAEPPLGAITESIRTRLSAGLSFTFRDPIMRPTLLAVAWINLFNFAFAALFILYVTTHLGVSPGLLGAALGAGAVGGLIGALTAPAIGRRFGLGPAYALGCLIFPLPLVLIPIVDGPPLAVLAMLFATEFVAGLGVQILDINAGAIITARVPDRIRASAGGAFRFINYGIRPVGAIMGGVLGGVIGVRETLLVVTVAGVAGVLWLVGSPVLRLRGLPDQAVLPARDGP
ncbi:MAG TPA: MFS transporter [Candidatus Dormibacteraeota bacterium]|nr:MFS transporter [Candidatus Dormibacteraeota bacterium]